MSKPLVLLLQLAALYLIFDIGFTYRDAGELEIGKIILTVALIVMAGAGIRERFKKEKKS